MPEISHCQGCGVPAGEPKVSYRRKRNGERVKNVGNPVELMPTIWADCGERMMCLDCRQAVRKMNYRLASGHLKLALARPGK